MIILPTPANWCTINHMTMIIICPHGLPSSKCTPCRSEYHKNWRKCHSERNSEIIQKRRAYSKRYKIENPELCRKLAEKYKKIRREQTRQKRLDRIENNLSKCRVHGLTTDVSLQGIRHGIPFYICRLCQNARCRKAMKKRRENIGIRAHMQTQHTDTRHYCPTIEQ